MGTEVDAMKEWMFAWLIRMRDHGHTPLESDEALFRAYFEAPAEITACGFFVVRRDTLGRLWALPVNV